LLEAARVTDEYSSNRLVWVINNPEGEFVLMARQVDGSNDRIWGFNSSNLGSAKLYHNGQLCFVEEGIGSIIIEGSLRVLYSLSLPWGLLLEMHWQYFLLLLSYTFCKKIGF